MFINSTASRALRPRHGAVPACALSPWKVYSTDTMPVASPVPHETARLSPTCVKRTTSTSLKQPCAHQVCLGPELLFTDARPELDRARELGSLHQPFDRNRGRDVEGLTRIMALAVSRRAIDQRFVTSDARFLRSLGDAVDVGAERDHRLARSPGRHPGRRNARDAAFDREAFLLEDLGQILRGLELLKPQLREAEDHVIHDLASLLHRFDLVDDLPLDILVRDLIADVRPA